MQWYSLVYTTPLCPRRRRRYLLLLLSSLPSLPKLCNKKIEFYICLVWLSCTETNAQQTKKRLRCLLIIVEIIERREMIIRQVVHVYCAAHQRIRKTFETGRREEFRNDTGTHLGNSFCSSRKMWQKEKTNHVDAHQFTIRCELNGNRRRKSSGKEMTKIPNRTENAIFKNCYFKPFHLGIFGTCTQFRYRNFVSFWWTVFNSMPWHVPGL